MLSRDRQVRDRARSSGRPSRCRRSRGVRSLTTRPPIRIVAGGRLLEARDHAQDRRLAGARRAEEHQELAVPRSRCRRRRRRFLRRRIPLGQPARRDGTPLSASARIVAVRGVLGSAAASRRASRACRTTRPRTFSSMPSLRWIGGKARCSQSMRSHSRQVIPIGTAAFEVVDVDAVAVDEVLRVADLAAERDRQQRMRRREAAEALAHGAGDAEVRRAVRHAGELRAHDARRHEGAVHVPARAEAREAREPDSRGGEALGDVAGDVDADEVERARPPAPAAASSSGDGRPARSSRRSAARAARCRTAASRADSRKGP